MSPLNDIYYEVLNMETSGEIDRNLLNLNLKLSNLIQSPSITSIDTLTPKEEYQSGNDFLKMLSSQFSKYSHF